MLTILNTQWRKVAKKIPDTLFVIAAGNDGTDNDSYPSFPSNGNLDNTISVAATLKDRSLASFSNYGEKTVEIAAPGVSIYSTVPGNTYMTASGTSQAAPYVTKAASMVKDSNPSLSPKQIKEILMRTVTKKNFLKGVVISEGVLHEERAVYAAELSNTMDLNSAIELSLREIDDPYSPKSSVGNPFAKDLKDFVRPLPVLLSFERILD